MNQYVAVLGPEISFVDLCLSTCLLERELTLTGLSVDPVPFYQFAMSKACYQAWYNYLEEMH